MPRLGSEPWIFQKFYHWAGLPVLMSFVDVCSKWTAPEFLACLEGYEWISTKNTSRSSYCKLVTTTKDLQSWTLKVKKTCPGWGANLGSFYCFATELGWQCLCLSWIYFQMNITQMFCLIGGVCVYKHKNTTRSSCCKLITNYQRAPILDLKI